MAAKKLTDSEKIAAIIAVLKANGISLPASLDPPAKKEADED
jgi:hypothetical protein